MPLYVFQAKASNGKFVRGEVEANSEAEARVRIRSQKLMPIKIVQKGSNFGAKVKKKSAAGGAVKAKELQVFTRQFAVLIAAGVPVVQSLEAMVGGGRSPQLNAALEDVVAEVGKGRRLAECMSAHPKAFDHMYVSLVRAGEEGGVLETILNRLAFYIEKSVKLRGKITGAMWYPAVILVVAFLVIAGILIFVIPKFVSMFDQAGQELPGLTLFVMNLSDFFINYWYLVFGGVTGLVFSLRAYYQTEDGRKTLDHIFLETPVLGDLILKGAIARFSRTLATMLTSGVRIVDAIDISVSSVGNYVLERVLLSSKDAISKGRTLSEPLKQSKYIPDMVTQMIAVGEQTGNLDAMLEKVADFYEDEVETASEALTSLIEPLLMVFLGVIIAVLVIAMYLPVLNMAGAMTGG